MDASDSDSARFAKKLYLSCSDSVSRQSAGLMPLRELLRNVPCGPIYKDCTNFNTSIYSWERHAAMVASLLGQSNIIVADRSVHPNDSRRVILSLSPPDLTSLLGPIESDLARSAQANSDEYNRLLVTAVKQRLLNEPTQSLLYTDPVENRDLVDEVADFMISLHKARLPSEAKSAMRRNEYRITLDQRALTSRYSEIDWTAFFNAELNSALRVNESDLIIVEDQFYFRTLANIIRGRPARAIADYLTLMTVISLKALLPSDYQSSSTINSATSTASSWRLCVDQMMRFEPTMKIYLDEHVNAKQRNDLTLLANDIRSAFLKVLPVSSEENFYNIRNVQFKIAASNRILTGQASATYDKINFNASDYFTTYVNAMKQQRNEEIHQIGTSIQPDDSPHFPSLASASIFYDADENSVIIPASTLQPPFILPSENAPKYTVFATMGSFIGQALASSVEDLSTNTTIACYQEKINLVNRTGTSTAMQVNFAINCGTIQFTYT
uniref:Peptidase M13 N-terminal domain-containing protein n=1 Tax=Plectus sambesii TaxID=2011161 RepID=A0A914X558_9BILA